MRSGPFHLCEAITLDELADVELPWAWPRIAVHPDVPVWGWPALVLDRDDARRWQQGSTIAATTSTAGPIRAYDAEGIWLGTGHADASGSGWRPRKVVAKESAA